MLNGKSSEIKIFSDNFAFKEHQRLGRLVSFIHATSKKCQASEPKLPRFCVFGQISAAIQLIHSIIIQAKKKKKRGGGG